jgi:hypothetical protein
MPESLPSTMLALVSIGALAAMASCDQVSPLLSFMARPSSIMSMSLVLVSFMSVSALRAAFGKRVNGLACSSSSIMGVRITRCG